MKDKDYIQELFSQKLSNHEVPVRSDLWSGIQSQIGNTATTAAASGGISAAAKWAIGIASSVIVAGFVVWFSSDGDTEQKKDAQVSQVAQKGAETAPEEEAATVNTASDQENNVLSEVTNTAVIPDDQKKIDKRTGNMDARTTGVVNGQEPATPLIVKQQSPSVSPVSPEYTEKSSASIKRDQQPVSGSDAGGGTSSDAKQKPVVGNIQEWVNVFSPNGDSYNDNFELKTNNLKDFSITVLNEKNQVVFTSEDPDFKWNGIDIKTGEMVPNGNYGYVVIARDNNGNLIKMFKNLTITR